MGRERIINEALARYHDAKALGYANVTALRKAVVYAVDKTISESKNG